MQKHFVVTPVPEHRLLTVPPAHHMIDSPCILHSRFSWHRTDSSSSLLSERKAASLDKNPAFHYTFPYKTALQNDLLGRMPQLPEKRFPINYTLTIMSDDYTQVLRSVAKGDLAESEDLLPLIYDELRKLARMHMARVSGGHTLQATVLVHEAWLRLVENGDHTWGNRSCFFAAASKVMRHILVDHARRKAGLKHGGGQLRLDIDAIDLAAAEKEEAILMVDEAIEMLEQVNPQRAQIVVFRFFGGMTHKEVADALGISERTVIRQWICARSWLINAIRGLQ